MPSRVRVFSRRKTFVTPLAVTHLAILALHACTAPLAAQTPTARVQPSLSGIKPNAPDSLFDFLVGEWRVEATPRISRLAAFVHGTPRYTGYWRGRKTGAGVSDELRLADADGTTRLLWRFARVQDATTGAWSVRETDRNGATSKPLQPVVTREGLVLPAASGMTRSRFVERSRTRFRYVREVSSDGGRTWEEPVLVVTATRTTDNRTPPRQ